MNTIVQTPKVTTSFRLDSVLLERLRTMAKRSNRSLNNYVETVLLDFAYNEPNEETAEALKEAVSNKHLDKFDMSELEKMIEAL